MSELFNLLFEIDSVKFFFNFILILFFLISLVIGAWIIDDSYKRFDNKNLAIFIGVSLSLTSIFGLIIYTIIRPDTTSVERAKLLTFEELELSRLGSKSCVFCKKEIPIDSVFCFSCGKAVATECPNCKSLIEIKWNYCKKCGASKNTLGKNDEIPEHIKKIKKISSKIEKNDLYNQEKVIENESFVSDLRKFFIDTFFKIKDLLKTKSAK